MATIDIPTHPAIANYPDESSFADELAAAKAFFESELTSSEGWETAGERDGVSLDRKADAVDPYAVPIVRGTCLVENATTEQVLSVIQQPGMRLQWDPRFESGHMLRRHSRTSFVFASTMKGMGWLVWPRDIIGIQKNYRSEKLNQEISIVQASIEDPEYPAASGKVRAKLTGAGWRLKPVDDNVELSYLVKISLEGSIPGAMVQMVATEIPTCTGRVRDALYSHGYPPYVIPTDNEPTSIFQTEEFVRDPPSWRCSFTGKAGDHWAVLYDPTRMFLNGVSVAPVDGVTIKDDGNGRFDVSIGEAADGKACELNVTAA